jgi:hypothetical protein
MTLDEEFDNIIQIPAHHFISSLPAGLSVHHS